MSEKDVKPSRLLFYQVREICKRNSSQCIVPEGKVQRSHYASSLRGSLSPFGAKGKCMTLNLRQTNTKAVKRTLAPWQYLPKGLWTRSMKIIVAIASNVTKRWPHYRSPTWWGLCCHLQRLAGLALQWAAYIISTLGIRRTTTSYQALVWNRSIRQLLNHLTLRGLSQA